MAATTEQDEESFKDMWLKASIRFEETTKSKLVKKNNESLDDVIQVLNDKFDVKDSENGSKAARVKELATNVLTFIQLLGGIAAQGASMVFGPAQLCFNAVNFLISIPGKISKFYDDLALLFEQIQNFLTQFKIYKRVEQFANIDRELKEGTNKLMICFVDICALSIDTLTGSRLRRFKNLAKIALFDNDSGVSAKLEEFKRLVELHSHISDAITLEHVLKSETEITSSMQNVFKMLRDASEDSRMRLEEHSQNIQNELEAVKATQDIVVQGQDILIQDVAERTTAKDLDKHIDQICTHLGIKSSAGLKPKEDFEQKRRESLMNSGAWLQDVESYKAWIDLGSKAPSVLFLKGPAGCGKSTIVSTIPGQLKKGSSQSNTRASYACYGFSRNEKLSFEKGSKDSRPSIMAFKSIAVQIAKSNKVYAKNLASYLETKDPSYPGDLGPEELFQDLFSATTTRDIPDVCYVLLFDGLEQLSQDEASQLFRPFADLGSSKTIRVAFTGTDDAIRDCCAVWWKDPDSYPTTRVAEQNEPDLRLYIESKMKDFVVSQGKEAAISLRVAEALKANLPSVAEGNYTSADIILNSVEEAFQAGVPEEKCKDLINVSTLLNRDESAQAARLVQHLNDSLSQPDIEQLNELLVWAIFAKGDVSIEDVSIALYLRTGLKPRRLENIIRDKYSHLLDLVQDDDRSLVQLKDSKQFIGEYFRNSKRVKPLDSAESENDPRITMTISISNTKLSQVQRFLWDLSEKVVIDKFEFTKNLGTSASQSTVMSSTVEANLLLARRCFDVLLGEPSAETEPLTSYALLWLPMHLTTLKDSVDDEFVTISEKTWILKNLLDVLQSPNYVDQHMDRDFLGNPFLWLQDGYGLTTLEWWLQDSDAKATLTRKDRNWVNDVTNGPRASMLKGIALVVGKYWLRSPKFAAVSAFYWLDEFLDRNCEKTPTARDSRETRPDEAEATTSGESDSKQTSEEPEAEITLTIIARISRASDWLERELPLKDKDALWYQRLGQTYYAYDENTLAIAALLKAKEQPNGSYKISETLATVYAAESNKQDAIREMDTVLAYLREKADPSDEEKSDLVEDLITSSQRQTELSNTAQAIVRLKEVIELDPDHFKGIYELLKVFVDAGQKSEALQLLQGLSAQRSKVDGLTRLASMLLEFSSWIEPIQCFEIVFQATAGDEMFQVTLETIEKTLEHAQSKTSNAIIIDLLLGYGRALYRHSTEKSGVEKALEQWRECYRLGSQPGSSGKWDSALVAARCIFNYHLAEARSVTTADQDLESHVADLERLLHGANAVPYHNVQLLLPHASFHSILGQKDKARALLRDEFKSGLDWLDDDDPENDGSGWSIIANVLTHIGDDLGALSAWSLYGPPERHRKIPQVSELQNGDTASESQEEKPCKSAPTSFWCDGGCNVPIRYDDGAWCCKICDDIQFHGSCLQKLRSQSLKRFTCSPDHEWLRIPSWEAEFARTGRDRVRVGGTIEDDGTWTGGDLVPVNKWLDELKENWGIEKKSAQLTEEVP